MLYSNEEKVKILLICGECGINSVRALQLYTARHPEKTQPSRHMFARLIKNLCETGRKTHGSEIDVKLVRTKLL
jgi:hypothetical protein